MISSQPNRVPLLLAGVGVLLLISTFFHHFHGISESLRASFVGGGTAKHHEATGHTASRPSFYEIALSHGTDKVTKDHYHYRNISPYRDKHLKMLEIGLGCDMSDGPGASFYTWLEYFPYVELYFIEYDDACAEKWAANTTKATIFVGDQADVGFLNSFIEEAGTNFDIIIDDGRHRMTQQISSLETL